MHSFQESPNANISVFKHVPSNFCNILFFQFTLWIDICTWKNTLHNTIFLIPVTFNSSCSKFLWTNLENIKHKTVLSVRVMKFKNVVSTLNECERKYVPFSLALQEETLNLLKIQSVSRWRFLKKSQLSPNLEPAASVLKTPFHPWPVLFSKTQ